MNLIFRLFPLIALMSLGALIAPSSATAEADRDESARTHFHSGTEYFRRGSYADAEREFVAAYELSGRPELLYNIYLSRERLGKLEEAADALRQYLERLPDAADRPTLEARLENLEKRVSELRAAEAAREAEIEAARAHETGGEKASEPSSRRLPVPATIAFGVGGAGLLTFAIAGGLAIAEDNALASSCGRDAGRTCTEDETKSLERRRVVADTGLAVGLAGAATGLVLALLLRNKEKAPRETAFSAVPVLTPGHAGLSAELRF